MFDAESFYEKMVLAAKILLYLTVFGFTIKFLLVYLPLLLKVDFLRSGRFFR